MSLCVYARLLCIHTLDHSFSMSVVPSYLSETTGQFLGTSRGSPLPASMDTRANSATHLIKMLLLQSSKKLSDRDGESDFSIGGKKGPKLDFYKKNIAYLFPQ